MADAGSTITTMNDAVVNAAVIEEIIAAARGKFTLADKIAAYKLPEKGPRAMTIAKFGSLAMQDYATEAANADSQEVSTDGVTITASLGVLDVEISDLLDGSGLSTLTPQTIAEMGRAAQEYLEKKASLLHIGFSVVKGTSAATLTLANCRAAKVALSAANPEVGAPGTSFVGPFWQLHPTQVGQLVDEAAASSAAVFSQPTESEFLRSDGTRMDGYIGKFLGYPAFETTTIVSDGTNLHGALMVPGAYGIATKYLARYEMYRDMKTREWRHGLTSFFGVAERVDTWGVELLSGA